MKLSPLTWPYRLCPKRVPMVVHGDLDGAPACSNWSRWHMSISIKPTTNTCLHSRLGSCYVTWAVKLLLYCLSNQNKALKAKWVLSLLLQGFINTWCLYIVPFCHHKGPVMKRFDAFVDAINYFLHFSFCFILIIPRLIELCPLNSQSHPVSLWCWHLTCNLEKYYSLIIMISPRKNFLA